MTTTAANPASMPQSSEQRYIPADSTKRNSITQDIQRKERSFQECLEFLMPVYLLPFVFGDRAGTAIYCVLLTVVGLMGRLIPATVAAVLPIVILPLGGVSTPDKLAAEYMGPHVLTAFLLFAIAILGDETTVFFRLCLYALQRYALRLQPLFLYLQFLVFALSLLLPSALVVVFSTVFIDRFVTTVHNEITADQRGSVRIQTNSTQNYFDDGRRPRWLRRTSLQPAFARRGRSLSVVSDTTLASEASAGSSIIRQFRMHPPTPPLEAPAAGRGHGRMGVRKTSFGTFDMQGDERPYYLPVRRIRSFSVEPSQPSSILKRSPAPPPPPSSPPPETPQDWDTCPAGITTASEARRRSTQPMGEFFLQEAARLAAPRSSHDWHKETSTPRAVPAPIVLSPSTPTFGTAQGSALPSPEKKRDVTVVPAGSWPACVSQPPTSSCTGTSSSPSPVSAKSSTSLTDPSPSPRSSRSRHRRRHQADTPLISKTTDFKARSQVHAPPAGETQPPREHQTGGHSPPPADKRRGSRRSSKVTQRVTDGEPKPEQKIESTTTSKCVVLPEAMPEAILELGAVQQQQQDPEPRQPEVRGVLKKRNASLQSSLASRRDSAFARQPLLSRASLDNVTDRRNLLAPQTSQSESRAPADRVSSFCFNGAEQQTSSLRVRALTNAARPAFVAGVAYTAIFGNLVNFNTLSTRKTLLATLGCQDDECPVNFWSWLAVSLPVALICCIACWTAIYCAGLVSCDDEVDEQTHDDMSKSARIRHRNMKRHSVWEALVFYWIVGIPVASCAYGFRDPDRYMEGPLLGLALLGLSVSPAYSLRRCWTHRMLCWRDLCSRMPWNLILMLGSVLALTRTIEAVVTETPVSFYVVPVSLAASINVMLPVSLPLLVMREYLHTKCTQMVAYGVFLKCTSVVAIFVLMNTIGLIVFQGDTQPGRQMTLALTNASHIYTEIF
ncbi:uncharacterized protein [Dermacentor albipictus]|uniref:uncharacterized protein isoform X2 n=1 Tax=Dermacentor albipictus TaxID=60249 RepID=UPI0031FDF11B